MTGRARRVPKEASLSHVQPAEKTSSLPKKTGTLATVPEVKDQNHRSRSNAAVAPIKVNKEAYTVRDILRGKRPPSSPKAASKQGPTLTRSKSSCGPAPGFTRGTDPGFARVISPSAPSAPPPPVQPAEPIGKPTGLRKPSPKLGFFDAVRSYCFAGNCSLQLDSASTTNFVSNNISFLLVVCAATMLLLRPNYEFVDYEQSGSMLIATVDT